MRAMCSVPHKRIVQTPAWYPVEQGPTKGIARPAPGFGLRTIGAISSATEATHGVR